MVDVVTKTNSSTAKTLVFAGNVIGGTSLLAFAIFLFRGPVQFVDLARTDAGALAVNAILSLGFFVQHSGMVRRSTRDRLAAFLPRYLHGVVYSMVSGLTLIAVVGSWQPTEWIVVLIGVPYRLALRALYVAAVLSFVWGIRALGSFDGFGVRPVRAHLRGEPVRELPLSIRGPYRWVRHPLYTMVLVMIWSNPDLTGDRLFFNITWTVWIVIGNILEERDLVRDFGEDYNRYRELVPMLIPWRFTRV